MISYAQNFEDVVLNRVFRDRATGFYIDVGAMDPVDGSVTKTFYDRGWCGINIEPDVRFYERLVTSRTRDVNLWVALGESDEIRPFYQFEDQGISTLNTHFRDYFQERRHTWREERRQLCTLAQICDDHVRTPVDFLKIDAEGWEGPILRGGDWEKFRPLVLVIEATEPFSSTPAWQDWEPYLTSSCGYIFVYFDGLNRFYVRQEDRELAVAFAYPPNVLDGFQLYAVIKAEQSTREAQAQVQQASADVDKLSAEVNRLSAELNRLSAELNGTSGELARTVEEKAKFELALEHIRLRATDLEKEVLENRRWIGRLSEILAALQK